MIEIKEGIFIHTIWIIERGSPFPLDQKNNGGQIMVSLIKDETSEWLLKSRIRMYVDNNTHDSQDPKIAIPAFHFGRDAEKALHMSKLAIQGFRREFQGQMDIVQIEKDGSETEAIISILENVPCFHIKRIDLNEKSPVR